MNIVNGHRNLSLPLWEGSSAVQRPLARARWLAKGHTGKQAAPGLELPTSNLDDVTREPVHADPTRSPLRFPGLLFMCEYHQDPFIRS